MIYVNSEDVGSNTLCLHLSCICQQYLFSVFCTSVDQIFHHCHVPHPQLGDAVAHCSIKISCNYLYRRKQHLHKNQNS